jgi:hypothetical protein
MPRRDDHDPHPAHERIKVLTMPTHRLSSRTTALLIIPAILAACGGGGGSGGGQPLPTPTPGPLTLNQQAAQPADLSAPAAAARFVATTLSLGELSAFAKRSAAGHRTPLRRLWPARRVHTAKASETFDCETSGSVTESDLENVDVGSPFAPAQLFSVFRDEFDDCRSGDATASLVNDGRLEFGFGQTDASVEYDGSGTPGGAPFRISFTSQSAEGDFALSYTVREVMHQRAQASGAFDVRFNTDVRLDLFDDPADAPATTHAFLALYGAAGGGGLFQESFDGESLALTGRAAFAAEGPGVAGSCGSGGADVTTLDPLLLDDQQFFPAAGQLRYASGASVATAVFSGGTVTVTAGGSTQTFDEAQIRELVSGCNVIFERF